MITHRKLVFTYIYEYIIACLLLFSVCINSAYSNTIKITDNTVDFLISQSDINLFEDSTHKYTIESIRSTLSAKDFTKSSDAPILHTTSTYWAKFTILNSSNIDQNWIIQFPLHSKEIWIYIPDSHGILHEYRVGQDLPFNSRPINIRTLSFELPSLRNTPQDIYFKIIPQKYTDLSIVISTESKYLGVHTFGYFFLGLIYGVLFLMLIYNIILYFTIRENIYLYYVFYTLCSSFFLSRMDGLGFEMLWPQLPSINGYHHSLSLFLLVTSFLLFANNLLEVRKTHPKLNVISYVLIFSNILYFIFTSLYHNYFNPVPLLYIISYLYLLTVSIYYLKHNYKPARYLLISLACMLCALVVIKLRFLNLIDWNWFIEYILNYAIVVDAIAMSLAISDKLSYLKEREIVRIEKERLKEKLTIENELFQLKNRNLHFEIEEQNNQLAYFATNSIEKQEFISTIKKELENILLEIPQSTTVKKLIKSIDSEDDNRWDQFQLNFDRAHHNFLKGLKEEYLNLKPGDLLLCAYVRLGKSNKEIATILNITVSGVEKKKVRLKEKLLLDTDISLIDFIQNR